MGLDQSRPLEQWSSLEVADELRKLGVQYAPYAATVLENGVDGAFLLGLKAFEIHETMDDLKIQSRLHRRVLDKKLANLLGTSGIVNTGNIMQHESTCGASGRNLDLTVSSTDDVLLMSPSSVVTSRSILRDDTERTPDHCRRYNRRRSTRLSLAGRRPSLSCSSIVLDLDKSEVLATTMVSAMDEEKSERDALLRRQMSLTNQIEALASIQAISR